jgi:uncharacterized protein (TIGR03437 family)
MLAKTLFLALFACTATVLGAFRAEQLTHVPLQRGQTLNSLTADQSGNLIVTGQNVQGGFICKLDLSGNVVFYYPNFGAFPAAAAVDNDGDVYWIGTGGGPGFPFPFTKKVLPIAQLGSSTPGFVVKFRGTDGLIVWAAELDAIQPQTIVLDQSGLITLAGAATTAPGIATAGAYQSPGTGTVAPLGIVRLTAAGDVIFAATFGGRSVDGVSTCVSGPFFRCNSDPLVSAASVLLDSEGHIWVAGSTNEIDLPVTPNALKKECGCRLFVGDGFLAEFSSDATQLLYSTYLGTSGDDGVTSAAMDQLGRIWLAGSTNGTDLSTTSGALQSELQGNADGFLLQYDPKTNKLLNSTYFGSTGTNNISRIVIGPDGRPIFAGRLKFNPNNAYSSGNNFVARLNSSAIDITEFPRYGADAGIAFLPSGSLAVAGSGSAITTLNESSAAGPSVAAVTNSASLDASGSVSPGEMVTIFGLNLGSKLSGTQVFFDGVAAPLLFVSSDQINAIVPFGIAGRQETKMVVENSGVASSEARLGVVPAVPAIFLTDAITGYLPVAAALNEDGTINTSANRAAPGSVVSVFATGLGSLAPQPVDGEPITGKLPVLQELVDVFGPGFVDLLYAGPAPSQIAGAMQINFRVPLDSGTSPFLLFAGGWSAPYFTVWITGK